ncbi:MAG: DUF4271 domain-containing protein [Bacteroidales bacterium]
MIADTGDTTLVSPADTLPGIVVQEAFSIGRFIPFSGAKPGISGKTFTEKAVGTDYYSAPGRAVGQPQASDKMNADFGFILLSVCLLLITVLTAFGRKSMASGFAYLSFRRRGQMPAPGTSEVLSWPPIFRNIFTIINLGFFAAIALLFTDTLPNNGAASSMKLTAIIAVSFLTAFMLRHLTCVIVAEVSGQKMIFREYMNVIYNAWFANAIILFILNAIILFAPLRNTIPFIISGIIITAIFLVLRILRLLIIFLNRRILISYFILYLCALEVLPLLVIMKILGVF